MLAVVVLVLIASGLADEGFTMPATQEVTLEQLAAFANRQAAALARLSLRKPLQDCKVAIVTHTKENFVGSHDPDGSPWVPLKYPRASGRGGDRPLRDQGLLQASVAAGSVAQGHFES